MEYSTNQLNDTKDDGKYIRTDLGRHYDIVDFDYRTECLNKNLVRFLTLKLTNVLV